MSELTKSNIGRHGLHWLLLNTTSAMALLVMTSNASASDEGERPTVWIDLGGQLERIDSEETVLAPSFFANSPPNVLTPMIDAQRFPSFSIGGEGKISIVPSESGWMFSASVRYGRSNASRHLHYQSSHTTVQTVGGNQVTEYGRPLQKFGDGQSKLSESHFLLDFLVGKDVGLGLFGGRAKSTISAGVRYAQFTSKTDATLQARPYYLSSPKLDNPGAYQVHGARFHDYTAKFQSRRSTHAVGPTVSWDASLPIAGSDDRMSIAADWGINAAVLFGRQRSYVHHQTTGANLYDYPGGFFPSKISGYTNHPPDRNSSRSVIIPNVGAFGAVSFRYSNAKVKFGYRADFFFGATDSGIDATRKSNIGFYGPFATISIGLGG